MSGETLDRRKIHRISNNSLVNGDSGDFNDLGDALLKDFRRLVID
jgi:hypothetical protein